jgi:chromosome partitioning protein
MLDPEFVADHISGYIAPNASNIGGGLQSLFVMPCSIRIDDFSTNMAKARHGYKSTEEFQSIFDSRRRQIRTWLNNKYDFTIIDCPPSVALQVRMFLPIADGLVVPSVPDRLSVRGSLYLLDRIRRMGIKTQAYGTLWSLFRKQNSTHCRIVEATAKGVEPFNQLPRPFETIIPNASAIVEATELGQTPASFNAKYSHSFAKLFHDLCDEIVARSTFSENGRQVQKALATK